MRFISHFVGRMMWQRLRPRPADLNPVRWVGFDTPPRLGEILAASTLPDFAGLPLELWPGYRCRFTTDEPEEADRVATQPRSVKRND